MAGNQHVKENCKWGLCRAFISSRWVHLQLRSVLTEDLLCTVCSVPSDSGNWIMLPADKQLHRIKPLLDLKLISNFAGSLPTERSGWGAAVRMRIPPGKAGGIWGAQTTAKGRCGRAAADLHGCRSGRDFSLLSAGGAASSRAVPQVSPVRGGSWQENRLERASKARQPLPRPCREPPWSCR